MKSFYSPEESLREAKYHFDVGQFDKALYYLSDTVRLDPDNQSAYALLGVTWAKLGDATNARRAFESALRIPKDTADADVARSWLKRLDHPLPVAIFPFQNLAQSRSYGIERPSYEALTKLLFESGLYSIIDERQLSYWGSQRGSGQAQACETARDKGAKVAILGVISEFMMVEDRPIIYNIDQRYYTALLKVALQLYATSDCRLVDTLTATGAARQVPGQMDIVLQNALTVTFRQLAMKIHAALM